MRICALLLGGLLLLTTVLVFAQENEYTDWMASKALTTKLHEMDQDRMFPGIVEGRLNGAKIQYRAQFVPFLQNMEYFQSRWGLTEHRYKWYSVQLMRTGYTEFSHTTFVDLAGTTLHQATWVLILKEK